MLQPDLVGILSFLEFRPESSPPGSTTEAPVAVSLNLDQLGFGDGMDQVPGFLVNIVVSAQITRIVIGDPEIEVMLEPDPAVLILDDYFLTTKMGYKLAKPRLEIAGRQSLCNSTTGESYGIIVYAE